MESGSAGRDASDGLLEKFQRDLDQVFDKLTVLMASKSSELTDLLRAFVLRNFLPAVVMMQNVFEPDHLTFTVCRFVEAIPLSIKDNANVALYDAVVDGGKKCKVIVLGFLL
jgi:hypothetical protein